MANPTWPGTLPQFVLENGYQEQLPKLSIESQTDAGPPKQRRRFTVQVRPFTFTIRMTQAQRVTFETFFISTCLGGSIPFDWVNPFTQAAVTFRFRDPPPTYSVIGSIYCDAVINVWQLP